MALRSHERRRTQFRRWHERYLLLQKKAEWMMLRTLTFGQRFVSPFVPRSVLGGHSVMTFGLFDSIHRYVYEVRSTGITSCHVTMTDHFLSTSSYNFDLPTTDAQDFTQVLEKNGDAKVEHPYFLSDKNPYEEEVSLDGPATKVSFDQEPHA